jgi:formylglycine-generating enzyme required for sulfatase activity
VDVEGGQPYIAMEYLPGGSLLQRLEAGAPLPVPMALRILEEVAGALSYAHKKKLVHRDVKPANILFDEEDRARLVDFGLVRSLVESGLTSLDTLVGTPAYMAPEQWNQGELGPAVDIYALGVVAYELLTGQAPFAMETSASLLHAHLHLAPPDPRELNPDLHVGLAEALLKALEKDPAARYAKAQDLARALKQAWERGQRAAATQQTLAEQYDQVQEALQAGRWGALVNLCVTIRNLDPDYRDVGALLQLAASRLADEEEARQQQKALEQAFAEAQALLVTEPAKAVTTLEHLAEQAPQWEEVQTVLVAAQAAAEKQRLYASVVAQLEAACYDGACTDLLAFLKLEPEHEEARARLLEIAAALVTEVQGARTALEEAEGDASALQARVTELESALAGVRAAYAALQEIQAGWEQRAAEAEKSLRQSQATAQRQEKALRASQKQVEQYDALLLALEQREEAEARPLAQSLARSKAPGAGAVWSRLCPALQSAAVTPQDDRWVNPKDGKEYVRIPAGEFLYGDKKEKKTLPEYWIARTPVTNAEYARFVVETGYKPPEHWKGKIPPQDLAEHPVVNVNWEDAASYAEWAEGRLPTEEEWEKAARGTDGREYPWGNTFDKEKCNSAEGHIGGTTPVGQYSPAGDSPYGVADMAGNVWEWTASEHEKGGRVVRGGAFHADGWYVCCAFRDNWYPDFRYGFGGFRVVLSRA